MADANLLEVLSKESKVDDIIIYGNVRCAIGKPDYLGGSVKLKEGFFALVDVLALKCGGIDYFGTDYTDSKHIYFSKGSIVIALDDVEYIGKNVKVYGKGSKGCTIKRQRAKSFRDGVVAFSWVRDGSSWSIIPNRVVMISSKDVGGTSLDGYLVPFRHPDSTLGIMEYTGVSKVIPLDTNSLGGTWKYLDSGVDLSSLRLDLVSRDYTKGRSQFVDIVEESVTNLTKKAEEFSKELVSYIEKMAKSSEGEYVDKDSLLQASNILINRFAGGIGKFYNLRLDSNSKLKGRDVIDDFLEDISKEKFILGQEVDSDSNKDMNSLEIFKLVEELKSNVSLDYTVLLKPTGLGIMDNPFTYASCIMGCITGVGVEAIVSNYNSCYRHNSLSLENWFWCLFNNPYLCGLLGGSLSVEDCDRIFCSFFSGGSKEECVKYREYLVILEGIKNASSRYTLVNKNTLADSNILYSSKARGLVEKYGVPLSKNNIILVSKVCDNIIKMNPKGLGVSSSINLILDSLNAVGLIELVDDSVILSSDLHKEYYIYKTLYDMSTDSTGIEDKEIETTIKEFESSRGFKLEPLQKKGIHLTKYRVGVLSGCAGSGKTTTSDCMVECIKKYLPSYELRFGAPTGKAARRLSEVVGGGVKTIHSMFGLGLGGTPYITTKKIGSFRKNSEGVKYAYILDEMAMCNTNLMYEIVKNIDEESSLVYFLGDIKQLPPIGKGSPFKALMSYLPCIELGVSKRASENGKINYNCGLLNFASDGVVAELQEGDDFKIVGCRDAEIQSEVVGMFRNMLFRYDEDEIQVVTGYQTEKYPWSTYQLNPLLQKLLRKPKDLLYRYNDRNFMRGDRVIHINRNAYDMPRFRLQEGGMNHFEEVVTFGVVNGEVGKIVGYVKSTDCTIFSWVDEGDSEDSDMQALIEKRRNTSVSIRKESGYRDEHLYFVIVQVYDVDLCEDVYLLYHANYREGASYDYSMVFSGGDLGYLDLAYALTTHKMQGSQSKAIIIPLGSSSSSKFMNRNMLNTMITRASDEVALIGSVVGKSSALTNGRRVTSISEGNDILSILAD